MASADPAGYMAPGSGGGASLPSWADIAGPNTLLGAGTLPPNGRGPDRYGLHPCLKKMFHIPVANGPRVPGYGSPGYNPLQNPANWAAGGYGMGGPAYSPYGFPPGLYGPNSMNGAGPGAMYGAAGPAGCANCQANPYQQQQQFGPMMQGTLVFPYNSFVRSPRDYFMVDVNNK